MNVISESEIADLCRDAGRMLERAPISPDAGVDAKGRPALGRDAAREPYTIIKPLSDPAGGTDFGEGRHPRKMSEPTPDRQPAA